MRAHYLRLARRASALIGRRTQITPWFDAEDAPVTTHYRRHAHGIAWAAALLRGAAARAERGQS